MQCLAAKSINGRSLIYNNIQFYGQQKELQILHMKFESIRKYIVLLNIILTIWFQLQTMGQSPTTA